LELGLFGPSLGFYVRAESSIFRAKVGDDGPSSIKSPTDRPPKEKKEAKSMIHKNKENTYGLRETLNSFFILFVFK
jgi:hypothetical protein